MMYVKQAYKECDNNSVMSCVGLGLIDEIVNYPIPIFLYFSEEDVKKLKNLRTVFMREHGMVSDSSRSGAGTTEVYVPKWKHFQSWMFLHDSCIPDESSDNMDKPESEPSSSASSQTPDNATHLSPQPQPSETPTKKKTDKKAKENKAVEAMDYALDFLKRKATSPHTSFFQYLETILEGLPENKVKRLKREIINMALSAEEEE